MPAQKDPQGQSELATERKQRGLGYAFTLNKKVASKHKDWMPPYVHIDLNAGNGYNDKAGCVGSPITFMRVFRDHANMRAIFIDQDHAQLDVLKSRAIMQDEGSSFYCMDNAE